MCWTALNLRHGGPRGADRAAQAAPGLLDGEGKTGGKGSPQEPHESRAGLDLAAPLLDMTGRAESDPASAVVVGVDASAVGGAELSGEDDGGDEGEEDNQAIQSQQDDGDGEAGDEAGNQAVEDGEPGQGGDEHGKVDGGFGGATGIDVGGDDVADERGDEEHPEEGDASKGYVDDAAHDDGAIGMIANESSCYVLVNGAC